MLFALARQPKLRRSEGAGALAVIELIAEALILSSIERPKLSLYSHIYSHLLPRERFDSAPTAFVEMNK